MFRGNSFNLNSFIIQQGTNINSMFGGTTINYICYNKAGLKLYGLTSKYDCFNNQSKLIINNGTIIDECYNDNIYEYEYKNICFNSCSIISQDLYGISNYEIYFNYDKIKCINKIPLFK